MGKLLHRGRLRSCRGGFSALNFNMAIARAVIAFASSPNKSMLDPHSKAPREVRAMEVYHSIQTIDERSWMQSDDAAQDVIRFQRGQDLAQPVEIGEGFSASGLH
jgi:hypothetical protein